MALAVPLSRFTQRVGGGSAFFVRPLRTFMTKRTIGALFCCLAVVLFLARYAIALRYAGDHERGSYGSDLFAGYMSYVGIAPWVFATAFLIAGIYYLVRAESEK